MRVAVLGAGIVGVTTAYELAADGHEVVVVDRQDRAAMETSFSNAGMVSPGHAYTWASPRAPKILWQSLFRDDVALRLKLRLDPQMWSWCWRFLMECTAERAAINTAHKVRLCLYSQQRFAEINRSGSTDWSTIFSTLNPQDLDGEAADFFGQTVSDGLVRFLMSNDNANVQATIRAAISKGDFRSLAEPNLLTLPGQEATFLAGGEFPYPSVQSGDATTGAVGITFKEFGVKLKFTPTLTRSGTIRLQVAPEVSSLDFANGLTTNGFEVPLVLTRRTETEVELAEGQYLVLAGLIDSETISSVTKIPLLGDIPLLGEFFKSKNAQSRQTELMVLITPKIVRASDRHPQLPTGEPETWKWPGWMREEMQESTTRRELNIPQAPPAGAQQESRP